MNTDPSSARTVSTDPSSARAVNAEPDVAVAEAAKAVPLRRTRLGLYYAAAVVSLLALLLLVAAWRDDRSIDADKGTATAEVLSAGALRSTISFVTPDGENRNPKLGVLYPTNLTVGQRIGVEYAKSTPDLVRVAGRDATVALLPAGSVIVVAWAAAFGTLAVTRRIADRRRRDHESFA